MADLWKVHLGRLHIETGRVCWLQIIVKSVLKEVCGYIFEDLGVANVAFVVPTDVFYIVGMGRQDVFCRISTSCGDFEHLFFDMGKESFILLLLLFHVVRRVLALITTILFRLHECYLDYGII